MYWHNSKSVYAISLISTVINKVHKKEYQQECSKEQICHQLKQANTQKCDWSDRRTDRWQSRNPQHKPGYAGDKINVQHSMGKNVCFW